MISPHSHSQLAQIAQGVLGEKILDVTPIHGGGNNRIYKVTISSGSYALKFYPPQSEDPRDRLSQEYDAFEFISAHGIDQVPLPIGRNEEHHCALYQWIGGERVTDIGEAEVDALGAFLEKLQSLRNVVGVEKIRPASASCFSPTDVADQLLDRLTKLEAHASEFNEVHSFLSLHIRPSSERAIQILQEKCAIHAIDYTAALPRELQALSPSDFGFHNALRDRSGRIIFMDFEYFGWDDPVKMISDVMWHPGMNLSNDLGKRFQTQVSKHFKSSDATFSLRLDLLSPLYGLIWCLILLNEFLPERWARREAAGHKNARESRQYQLRKAKNLYRRICS